MSHHPMAAARGAARGLAAAALLAAAVLAGCAGGFGTTLQPETTAIGTPRATIEQTMGTPTGRYLLADGTERLQYSRQPFGPTVYNFDFGADGRLRTVAQALTREQFNQLPVGSWSRDDVQRMWGKPGWVEHVARFDGDIWTYRFVEPFTTFFFAHVFIDPQGVVRRLQYTEEMLRPPVKD